ncbi:unnamed protein product [Fusarium venenatum]|uniref:Uncharacterized protein n=1 Tax=Fusarium venenatum TaxID=56646 RepID=A0A2L2U2F3_9HYPO|nr:uncharacterized protein FVRRES_09827 [Fusarium venenatum]CEI69750.1 unnamed protein product [Fusarium venenatum]
MSSNLLLRQGLLLPRASRLFSPRRLCLVDKVTCEEEDKGRNEADNMALDIRSYKTQSEPLLWLYIPRILHKSSIVKRPKANISGMPLDEEPLTNELTTSLALVGGFKTLGGLSNPNVVAGIYSLVLFPLDTKTQVQGKNQRPPHNHGKLLRIFFLLIAEDAIVVYIARHVRKDREVIDISGEPGFSAKRRPMYVQVNKAFEYLDKGRETMLSDDTIC